MKNVKPRFSQSDLDQIQNAISSAEKSTSGEIVPVIVGQSDRYPGAIWRLCIVFSLVAAFLGYCLMPNFKPYWYLLSILPFLWITHVLLNIYPFNRIIALGFSPSEIDEEVFQRALQEFQEHKIGNTERRTGILIFLSLLEHRVVVLADEGINSRVNPNVWQEIVDHLIVEIKRKELVNGVCVAIHRCGEILSEHLPKTPNNQNELPNQLIVKDF